ncbi:MAG TPA: hypothetical protein VFL57_18695 [Bryobacteraceae bacterium]|nr:hypothetical protein [Bryobacteraceae bacterium]
MTDEEVRRYLAENGYPLHVVQAGREGLIRRWREFVEEVERGYEYGLEDYRNDLDLRGVIAMAGLDHDVADMDKRLAAMLTRTDVRVWESASQHPFWDFGYPRNASGPLLKDLRRAGLTE